MSKFIKIKDTLTERVTTLIPSLNKQMRFERKSVLSNAHIVHKDCKRQFTRKQPEFAFNECRVEKIDFENVLLNNPLVRTEFKDCTFKRCNIERTVARMLRFKDTAAENFHIIGCDIALSRFEGEYLEFGYFERCRISYTTFKKIAFTRFSFFDCHLSNVRFVDLPSAEIAFCGCTLENCVFDVPRDICEQIGFSQCEGAPELG